MEPEFTEEERERIMQEIMMNTTKQLMDSDRHINYIHSHIMRNRELCIGLCCSREHYLHGIDYDSKASAILDVIDRYFELVKNKK